MFWREGGSYTSNLDEAAQFTRERAVKQLRRLLQLRCEERSMSLVMLPRPRRLGKNLTVLVWYAHNHGWAITFTRGGHLRLKKPGRPIIHARKTTGDKGEVNNALGVLVRTDAKK